MNKNYILNKIELFILNRFPSYDSYISDDYLYFILKENYTERMFSIRCQNFGEVYLINPKGISIKCVELENIFDTLVYEYLKPSINSDLTLLVSAQILGIGCNIIDYQIKEENDVDNYCFLFCNFIEQLVRIFFEPMMNPLFLSKFISNYSFESNNKINTGGLFPVQTFKKIFLLYIGGQKERYEEYKVGLEEQIKSLPQRKPEKKDDAKIYLENLYFLIQELESGNYIKQFV